VILLARLESSFHHLKQNLRIGSLRFLVVNVLMKIYYYRLSVSPSYLLIFFCADPLFVIDRLRLADVLQFGFGENFSLIELGGKQWNERLGVR
jgi:hypothetical protein